MDDRKKEESKMSLKPLGEITQKEELGRKILSPDINMSSTGLNMLRL